MHRRNGPLLRTATRVDVESLAKPLWLLINGCEWNQRPNQFEHLKSTVLGLIAQLAYCNPTKEEREHPHRARIVPSRLYQLLIRGELIDLVTLLANADFQNVALVSTQRYVTLVIPARDMLLIGVRGTQFAYDWYLNLATYKSQAQLNSGAAMLHAGFVSEAEKLADVLAKHLSLLTKKSSSYGNRSIYLGGHSLGGAVASILNSMPWAPPSFSVNAGYIYGAPRISGKVAQTMLRQPFATRRPLDIVPCVPPKLFGYSNFNLQNHTDGTAWTTADGPELLSFALWIATCAFGRFIRNHSIEGYFHELLVTAAEHPRVKPYWQHDDVTQALKEWNRDS